MRVFVSAVGQHDNLGDTVLRRAYLDVLRTVGPLEVYIGQKPPGYRAGLGLRPDDVVHESASTWRPAVSRALLGGRSMYAFDTGEIETTAPFAKRYLRLAPLLLASRARGGQVVSVGAGVRSPEAGRAAIAGVLRTASLVTWRDEISREWMRLGGVSPDWAFALGSPADDLAAGSDRPLLSVAIRQSLDHAARDRPDDAWVQRVRGLADAHGLRIAVTAQIGRDGPLAEELAARLGGEAIVWLDDDHGRQDERLRDVYRRSTAILTDRLHGAVIAATEGAVPVGLVSGPGDKVVRTLEAAGIHGTCVPRDLPAESLDTVGAALSRKDDVVEAVVRARRELARTGRSLRALAWSGS